MRNSHKNPRSAYTLVELMVAVTLSLVLLIGVTDMFRNMGDTINETQATLNMSQNLNNVALQLRLDLSDSNLDVLARKPAALVASPQGTEASATGYLEIIEGQGAPPGEIAKATNPMGEGKHVPMSLVAYSPDSPNGDMTVGDVDDILAFTATGNFRGLLDNGVIADAEDAEIIWFLRGTNLYRRVLMTRDSLQDVAATYQPGGSYAEDISISSNAVSPPKNTLADLERRENRFGRQTTGSTFPFPLHTGTYSNWYHLRMPTLEETVHLTWPSIDVVVPTTVTSAMTYPKPDGPPQAGDVISPQPYWDFWENPNGWNVLDPQTGSLDMYATNGGTNARNARAGEDIILSNVIGFDVKVWNPYWVPCGVHSVTGNPIAAPPQYIDLGQDRFWIVDAQGNGAWYNVDYRFDSADTVYTTSLDAGGDLVSVQIPADKVGYGFTLKGRYNTTTAVRREDQNTGTKDQWHDAELLDRDGGGTGYWPATATLMACVFDSWSNAPQYMLTPVNGFIPAPPYTEPLRGIQVTIRCFEPQSGAIKQIRVVRSFGN